MLKELESEGLLDLTLKLAFFKDFKLLHWIMLVLDTVEIDLEESTTYIQVTPTHPVPTLVRAISLQIDSGRDDAVRVDGNN